MPEDSSFPEDIYEHMNDAWDWLGIGDITVVKAVLVILACITVLLILRRIFSGFFVGSLGNYSPHYRTPFEAAEEEWERRPRKKMRTGFENVDPRIYDFRGPDPTPDLSNLRQPVDLSPLRDNINLDRLRRPPQPDLKMAQDLFIPKFKKNKRSEE